MTPDPSPVSPEPEAADTGAAPGASAAAAAPDAPGPRAHILVAAVGGGACATLGRALANWPDAPETAAINTDARALAQCGVSRTLVIGQKVAKGLGAGGDTDIGRMAANEDADSLRALVSGHQLLLLLVGLGGGAGTGSAPVLARIASEEGLLVFAFATLPFAFEGDNRAAQAKEGLEALKAACDAVIVLPNQHLVGLLPPDASLPQSFTFADRMMLAGVRGLWTLLAENNMMNLDFSDVQTLVEYNDNLCVFGYSETAGPGKADKALDALLHGPMLDSGKILANAGAVLLNVIGGPDLAVSELDTVRRGIADVMRPGGNLTVGAAILPDWHGRLALTVLTAERWMPIPADGESLTLSLESPTPATPSSRRKRTRKAAAAQPPLPSPSPSPFQDTSPTLHDGADLDIPTYIRQGKRISG